MAQSKKVSYLRGRQMRVTRLDANGRPIYGDGNVVTSEGFISLAYTTITEEGEAINVPNAAGKACVIETATPSFNGFGVEAVFCDVDFAMFEILTGQEVVLDADGQIIGITESTDIDLSTVNFALETWLGAQLKTGSPSTGSQGQFGYVLTPFLGGGLISDVTVENAAITFTVSGMSTKNGSGWGSGPHNVELVNGEAAPLRVPMKANDHRRIMTVEVAPPASFGGATPLLDPTDPALTDLTATVTGNEATFAPVPTGTDPVFYDLGDGTWDYAETGGYTHEYDGPGTYTVRATRGSSTVTETVVVA